MSLFSLGKGWSLEIKLLGSTKVLHRKVWGEDFLAQLLACSRTGQWSRTRKDRPSSAHNSALRKALILGLESLGNWWKLWIPCKLSALRRALLHRLGLSSSSPTSSWFHPKVRPWTPICKLLRQVSDGKNSTISNLLIWCNTQGSVEDFTHYRQPLLIVQNVHWWERKAERLKNLKLLWRAARFHKACEHQPFDWVPGFWISIQVSRMASRLK